MSVFEVGINYCVIINNSVRVTDSIQNLAQMPILGKICAPIIDAIRQN